MPAPPETSRIRSDPAGQNEVPQDIPVKTEQLIEEGISDHQAEIDALRRENAELRLAETERRRDEEALRREKDRVGAILSALDTGQSLVDPDMTIVWVNQEARDILPEQEPIGQKCYRYFESLNEPCEVCAAQRVFATGEVTRVEKCVSRRGRWMNIVAQPVKDASGRVTHVLESFTDITERKQAEEALRESEAKYRTLVETALDIVLIHDREKILYINPTGVNLLGASCPDEILGRNFLEIVHPDSRDRVRENVAIDLLGESSPITQLQILRVDGIPLWVEGRGVMAFIAGTPVVQVIMRDITERRRAEDALRESQAALEKAQEMAHIGNWTWDLRTDRTVVSRELVRIYGVDNGLEADNSVFLNSTHPEDRKMVEEAVQRAMTEHTKLSVDCRIVRPDGEVRFIHSEGEVVLDDQGQPIQFFGADQDITERKRAEEALQESEKKYRNLVELAPEPIAVHRQGKIVYVNPPCVTLFGAEKREDLIGKPTLQFVHPDDHELVKGRIHQMAETGTTVPRIAERFVKLDGQVIDVEVVASPIIYENLPSVMVLFRDITERKQAEESLKESEEKIRSILDRSLDALYRRNLLTGRSEYYSAAIEEITGFTVQETLAMTVDEILERVHPDDRPGVMAEKINVVSTATGGTVDYRFLCKDGTYRWISDRFRITYDAEGKPIFREGIVRDITEPKQAEAKLRAVMEREHLRVTELDATLASIASGVIIYDSTGVIVRVNEAVRRMIDRTSISLDPIHFEERQAVFGVLREDGTPLSLEATPNYRALHGETVQGEEVMVTRLNQEPLWVDTSAAPIRDGGGAIVGAIAILTDITERKRAEEALIRHTEELTRLHRELEVANREANLYLDILTHDIGNTENVSNLYADLLIESLEGEAAGYMKKLQRSVQKSIEILGTVSTIRRIYQASPELKQTDLDRAIRGAIEGFPTSAIHYTGAYYQVPADDLLGVVFNNLIGNAIKHGGPDVKVAVRVEECDDEVQISVEDTGPGVPDEDKKAIFHRYEQQKRGVGEGLGLYLVQLLVERYGGRVWVEDRVPGHPGEGAAFRFTLKKA